MGTTTLERKAGRTKTLPDSIVIYADGASHGNPGLSGAGVVFYDHKGTVLEEFREYLGETTNNVAEYGAVLLALRKAEERGVRAIVLRSDSEVVVRQLQRRYKVKSSNLVPLHAEARGRISKFDSFRAEHVYREKNKRADELANLAIEDAWHAWWKKVID